MNQNIFNVTAPMLYRCHVHRYYSGLSRMYLRVFKEHQTTPAFYILFSDVGYFSGPITWQSVDFRVAPTQECIDLMLECGMIGKAILQFPDAYASITDNARLYIATTTHTDVQIIASAATVLQSIPDEIK